MFLSSLRAAALFRAARAYRSWAEVDVAFLGRLGPVWKVAICSWCGSGFTFRRQGGLLRLGEGGVCPDCAQKALHRMGGEEWL